MKKQQIFFQHIWWLFFSSGEAAFKTLNTSFGWAKNPMIHRLPDLEKDIPVTLVYGSKSWVDNATGYHIKYLRNESYVEVAVSYFVIYKIKNLYVLILEHRRISWYASAFVNFNAIVAYWE